MLLYSIVYVSKTRKKYCHFVTTVASVNLDLCRLADFL